MPITQPPKKSIGRAFYSPNTQAYEVGWRGGMGQRSQNYFKNTFITLISLSAVTRGYIFTRFSQVLEISGATVSRNVTRAKNATVAFVQLAFSSRTATLFKRLLPLP